MLAGVGYTIVDVAGFTVLQRAVDDSVLARVFGTLESVALIATAAGAGIASIVNELVGPRAALLAAGLLLPAVTIAAARRLHAIDKESRVPIDRLVLLRRNPIFSPLPPAAIDALANRLAPEEHHAGEEIFRQGDRGDRSWEPGSCLSAPSWIPEQGLDLDTIRLPAPPCCLR